MCYVFTMNRTCHPPCSDSAQLPDTWTCSKCGEQPISEFYHAKCPTTVLGWRFVCKKCAKDRRRQQYANEDPEVGKQRVYAWRRANPEKNKLIQDRKHARHGHKYRKHMKTLRVDRRRAVLEHYSGSPPTCASCGTDIYEFLCIDHIDGGGNQHRKALKRKSDGFYRWLIQQGFPEGFRALCHNCNNALSSFGVAPKPEYFDAQ